MKPGDQVKSIDDILVAAEGRRSLVCPRYHFDAMTRPMPAAFVLSMQARTVNYMIKYGLFVHKPAAPFIRKKKKAAK